MTATTTPTIPYATPPASVKPHSWIAVTAFALGAFASGGMLLSVLAVAFPLMDAPASWETPAAIFGITMFIAWVLAIALSTIAMTREHTAKLYPMLGYLTVVLAVCLAAIFVNIA